MLGAGRLLKLRLAASFQIGQSSLQAAPNDRQAAGQAGLVKRFLMILWDGGGNVPPQLAIARENAPRARFVRADMTEVDFAPESFDAVVAFYSIIHVPRDEHDG